MNMTPINEAEAILASFWDAALSELEPWRVDPGAVHGLDIRQGWCSVAFEWARRPNKGPALRMARVFDVDCSDYDRLVLSLMAPPDAVVRLLAETNDGPRRIEAPPAGPKKRELTLELEGATRLNRVTIEIDAGGDDVAQGWFNWLGLQHADRLARMLAAQSMWDERWEKQLKDESFEPSFTPAYGLFLNADELNVLRDRHTALAANGGASPFAMAAEAAAKPPPESLIHDFVNFWGDSRYNRERDHGKFILNHGLNAAIAGHLLRDKRLLRLAELLPEPMRRCGDFGEAIISTDHESDVIPICDARYRLDMLSQAIMAGLLPDSAWRRMLRKTAERSGGWPINGFAAAEKNVLGVPPMADAAIAWGLIANPPAANAPDPEPRAFVQLPTMGPLVAQRRLDDEWVKLLIQGNQAGAGHTHEDKGSFVLEFAGETFAMDPGTCDYSHPLSGELKNCERHNMLVPYGTPIRPHPACPLPYDVKPTGTGDATAFHAEIDATPGWNGIFHRWHRTWDSPTPDVLTITDDYSLIAGEGVEFYWQTRLPVETHGNHAVIRGTRGQVDLEGPENSVWRLDTLPLLDGEQYRLALRVPGTAGAVTVKAYLDCRHRQHPVRNQPQQAKED